MSIDRIVFDDLSKAIADGNKLDSEIMRSFQNSLAEATTKIEVAFATAGLDENGNRKPVVPTGIINQSGIETKKEMP